jgi:hypothetical protein
MRHSAAENIRHYVRPDGARHTARRVEDTGPASLLGQRRPSGLRGTKGEVQTDGTNGRDSACADAPLEAHGAAASAAPRSSATLMAGERHNCE